MNKLAILCVIALIGWATDWPMFHRDLSHTGYSPDTGPSSPPQVAWTFYTGARPGGMARMSSPAVLDGKVYIGTTMTANNPCYDVFVSGNYAYLAMGQYGLCVVDITNPAVPFEVGSCSTYYAYAVHVTGNYAYVADYDGLRIINVSVPSSPTEVSFYNSYSAYDVFVSGNYAYLADYDTLIIINVSNPALPVRAGAYFNAAVTFLGVYVAGNYAYVAGGSDGGLQIINVSNPASPSQVGWFDTPGMAIRVYVSGNYAYVADFDQGLRIINVAAPSSPVEVGFYITTGVARGISVAGNYAYVAEGWYGIAKYGGLKVVDVSNPASPIGLGSYDRNNIGYDVQISGTLAYLAYYGSGLRIVSVANPSSLSEIGYFDNSRDFFCVDAGSGSEIWSFTASGSVTSSPAVSNDRAYFCTIDDRSIYCVDKNTGQLIWRYPTESIIIGSPAVSDGRVYVTSFDGYLYCLNATTNNPNGELFWRTYYSNKMPHVSPAVAGSFVYVAEGTPGGLPSYISCFDTSGTIVWQTLVGSGVGSSPALANNRLYEGSDDGYLYCLDMFNGDTIWRTSVGPNFATPAVANGRVYITNDMKEASTDSYYVWCINANTGAEIWKYNLANLIGWGDYYYGSGSSPAVAGGRVYVGTDRDGWVICLDALTGNSIWVYQCGTDQWNEFTDCSPAIVGDRMYIACRNGYLYAFGSIVGAEEEQTSMPTLYQNSPNPFATTTTIRYSVTSIENITVKIYDATGRLVKQFTQLLNDQLLNNEIIWSGDDDSGRILPAGVYFVRLRAGDFVSTKKIIVVR